MEDVMFGSQINFGDYCTSSNPAEYELKPCSEALIEFWVVIL